MRQIFNSARLFDGRSGPRLDAAVVVEDAHIMAVGATGEFESRKGDVVWDLAGRTLMPGMVSGHFHATFHDVGSAPGIPAAEFPPAVTAYRALANAQRAMHAGFTSVVSAGTPLDIDAQLESVIESGLFEGPRVIPCGRDTLSSLDPFTPWWLQLADAVRPLGRCDGAGEIRTAVRTCAARGARMFKMSVSTGHGIPGQDRRIFTSEEIRTAVETAHEVGIRVRTHVTGKRFILECIAAGVDILDHCDGLDEECIEAMARAGSIMLPSLYLPSKVSALSPVPNRESVEIDAMCAMLPRAVEAGVTICVGDDFGTGLTPHGDYIDEMALYVDQAGLSPIEILRWATSNGGRLMGRAKELGTIEAGRLADMIVVDGDPTVNLQVLAARRGIVAVMRDGRLVSGTLPSARARAAA
jgi:imidazolonepropionase-like amidohydrolase